MECVSCGRSYESNTPLCFDCSLLESEGGTPPMEWLYVRVRENEEEE